MSYRRDNIEVQFYDPACNVWRSTTRDAKTQAEAEAQLETIAANRRQKEWAKATPAITYRTVRVQSVCEVTGIFEKEMQPS